VSEEYTQLRFDFDAFDAAMAAALIENERLNEALRKVIDTIAQPEESE